MNKTFLRVINGIHDFEEEKTLIMFQSLVGIKQKGYLTKKQFLKIVKWKSHRPSKYYQLNTPKEIKDITRLAFSTKNDCLKIHILTALTGVNYPAASAILMFYDRKKYPVLDIRVWKQLYKMKVVKVNSRGQNFSLTQCALYFNNIRKIAKRLKLTSRQVEKRLFDFDKEKQVGNLYYNTSNNRMVAK